MRAYHPDLKRCLYLFADRDYPACVELAFTLFREHGTHELVQMGLISAQRLGAGGQLAAFGQQVAAILRNEAGGVGDCMGITLGLVSVEDVLARTDDPEVTCRAHFYAGSAHLTAYFLDPDPALDALRAARAAFDAAAGTDVDCVERKLASAELDTLPYAPLPGRPREDIEEYFCIKKPFETDGKTLVASPALIEALQRLIGFAEERFGLRHPLYWAALGELGWTYFAHAPAEAEPLLRRAAELSRATVGEHHPEHALALQGLGCVYSRLGRHDRSTTALRKVAEVFRRAKGDESDAHLGALIHLANAQGALSPAEAEKTARRALRLTESAQRLAAVVRPQILNNLARFLAARGRLGEARTLFDEVARGADASGRCGVWSNLGWVHLQLGNHEEAGRFMARAVTEALATNHHDTPTVLCNAGNVFDRIDAPDEAERLYRTAAEMMQKAGRTHHEQYAVCLSNIAQALMRTGRHEEAESYLLESLVREKAVLGESHPERAVTQMNLGVCYAQSYKWELASACFERARATLTAALGDDHLQMAACYTNSALLDARVGRPDQALAHLLSANRVTGGLLGQVFTAVAENDRLTYLASVRHHLDALLSFVRQRARTPDAVRAAFDLVQGRKGIGAEAAAVMRTSVLAGTYPHLGARLEQLAALRAEAAGLALARPGPDGPAAHQARLTERQSERDRLEAELAREIPELALERQARSFDRGALAAGLPAGSALLEYVLVEEIDCETPDAPFGSRAPARYLAFVLPAGAPDAVQLIDLGRADRIDDAVRAFRDRTVAAGATRDMTRRAPAPAPESAPDTPGQVLRGLVFDPLLSFLGGRMRLVVAPDASLSLLPFEALPAGRDRYLADDYLISYVGVGRDVLRHGRRPNRPAAPPVVAADPDFNLAEGADELLELPPDAPDFEPLDGAREEGRSVARLLGVRPWLGREVRKGPLRAVRSPRILHLATHGTFLPTTAAEAPAHTPLMARALPATRGTEELLGAPAIDNPMLRSLLALAGANTWFRQGQLPADAENGLLTAEDVLALDLQETELVVLSACQTGLGDVRAGEGVFGLRRAFVVAGARAILTSLWSVPDEPTRELMSDFYQRVLRGEPCADALRQAQLGVKSRYPEPVFWAGFICHGDPGPLPGSAQPPTQEDLPPAPPTEGKG